MKLIYKPESFGGTMARQSLKGKVAVITGTGSGMGKELALQLAEKGCRLAISDINEQSLKATADCIATDIFSESLDVSDRSAFEKHAEDVKKHYGRVDILINNAGVAISGRLNETSHQDFEWLMGINFWGVVNGTKSFLPMMLKQKSGTIVNMSSMLGLIALPAQGAYAASKFAVRGFTECLRQEMTLDNTGIHAICVHPGVIKTNIARNSRFYSDPLGNKDKEEAAKEFAEMARVSAADAAKTIIKGIEKRTPRILIGTDVKFVEKLQHLRPVYYSKTLKFLNNLRRKKSIVEKPSPVAAE